MNYKVILFLSSLVLTFLMVETANYFFYQDYNYYWGFDKDCMKYDKHLGTRLVGERARFVKYYHRAVIYDNTFTINNFGLPTTTDFTFEKDSARKRYILFGDSFSAGLFLHQPMPDRLQVLLDSLGAAIEVYSFSIDGGGIENWHSTFINEVIDRYDFDGIILASFADNFFRGFTIQESTDNYSYFARIDSDLEEHYQEHLRQVYSVASNAMIDKILSGEHQFLLMRIAQNIFNLSNLDQSIRYLNTINRSPFPCDSTYQPDQLNSIEAIESAMGNKRFKMLDEMMTYCKSNDKKIIVTSIPSKELLVHVIEDQHMRIIAQHHQTQFLDGFKLFAAEKDVEALYLEQDGHWNQKGSDLYAKALFKLLVQIESESSVKTN